MGSADVTETILSVFEVFERRRLPPALYTPIPTQRKDGRRDSDIEIERAALIVNNEGEVEEDYKDPYPKEKPIKMYRCFGKY